MGKKRSHQVTRSILKNFPEKAEKVLKEEDVSEEEVEQEPSGSESEAGDFEEAASDMDEEFSEEFSANDDELEGLDSDGQDDAEVDADEDDIQDLKQAKKAKKQQKEPLDLGFAIASILGEKANAEQPILARRKGIERKIEDAKLEAKARAVLRRQKLEAKDSARQVKADFSQANYEKLLKKVATKGVVQLFNAIQQHQVMKEKLAKEKAAAAGSRKSEVATQIKQISKTSFLDMLKGGSTAQLKKHS